MSDSGLFFGVYRGIVAENNDSSTTYPNRCRLRIRVPVVHGVDHPVEFLPWAEPCMSIFGGGIRAKSSTGQFVDSANYVSHGCIAIPPVGSSVWVMFEGGNPNSPVWIGTWYGKDVLTGRENEIPTQALSSGVYGKQYPEIFLLKFPFKLIDAVARLIGKAVDGLFLRVISSEVIELVFHQDHNYIRLDGRNKKITVNAKYWNVDVIAECKGKLGGNITLKAIPESSGSSSYGGNISIEGRNVTIKASNDISIEAQRQSYVFGKTYNTFASNGSIHGNAPHASGFEDH